MALRRVRPAVAEYPPGATYGPRTLSDYEFVWLYDGGATWLCGDHEIRLRPGVLLLARPGMRDRFDWDPDRASRHGYVHFDVLDTAALPPGEEWPVAREVSADGPIPALIRYLLWLAREPEPCWRDRAEETLALMVSLFVRGPLPNTAGQQRLPTQLEAVLDYIRANWASARLRTFSLAELAAAGNVSEGHLSRLAHQQFGVGLVSALEQLRLDRARTLLARTNLSVREVGDLCGFASPFHFSRRFRGRYGVSPRGFRRSADTADAPPIGPHLAALARRIWPEG